MVKKVEKNNSLKERVYKFYKKNIGKGKSFIAKHFIDEGESKSTVYYLIKCAEQGKDVGRKKGSGRPSKIATTNNIKKLKKLFNNKSGVSQRIAARKLKCSPSYVNKLLKQRTNIRCWKKKTVPKRTQKQIISARPKCRKMLENYRNSHFILDDESYFTLSNSTLSGNNTYYSDDVNNAPNNIKFKFKKKFEPKLMVWIAISPKGVSKPYFKPSKLAINQEVYLNECIKKRLIPFISKYHADSQYVFWPDKASSHYAKTVTDYLDANNIQYIPKDLNPANLPESRPIEDFWAKLKRKVYKQDWCAENVTQLKQRIRYCLQNIDKEFVQCLAGKVHQRLDFIRRHGVAY